MNKWRIVIKSDGEEGLVINYEQEGFTTNIVLARVDEYGCVDLEADLGRRNQTTRNKIGDGIDALMDLVVRALAKEECLIGKKMFVFDADEWGGKDVGDNSQFYHPATILEVRWDRGMLVATIRWQHNNKLSKGHFVDSMVPVETKDAE